MITRQKGGEKVSILAPCSTSRFPQHAAIVAEQVELLTPADGGGWGDNRGIKHRGPVRGADKRSNEGSADDNGARRGGLGSIGLSEGRGDRLRERLRDRLREGLREGRGKGKNKKRRANARGRAG